MRLLRIPLMASWLALASCGGSPTAPVNTPAPGDGDFARLSWQYVIFFLGRNPVVATYLGGAALDTSLASIDGKLRDHSPQALASEDARLAEFRKQFGAFDDDSLSPRRRIDRAVTLAQIDFLLHQHQVRKYQQRSLDSYVDEPFRGVDFQLQGMSANKDGTSGTDDEWHQLRSRVEAIPAYLAAARAQLQSGIDGGNTPDWRIVLAYGLHTARTDADYFETGLIGIARARIGGDHRQEQLAGIEKAGRQAAAAYRGFADWIGDAFIADPKASDALAVKPPFRADRFAMGEKEYDWALQNNLRIQKKTGQLYDEAWPIVQATQKSMIELAAQIAANHKWQIPAGAPGVRAILDKLGSDAPRSDAEMIAGYRDVAARIVQYARDTGLFDVPADYKLDVVETPPPLRSSIDGAAYYPAPPFKSTGVGRFYVTPTGNDPVLLRENHNRVKMADLAAHEGFPGHDWDYKVMTENRDDISLVRWLTPGAVEDSSSMWADSMAAEGWALYSEALLAEPQPKAPNGFYTPEEHLYQLQGQLYRDLRVRIDTGLHSGRLDFAAAVDLFSQVVDFLPGSCTDPKALKSPAKKGSCSEATGAINRYARWPTQAITYRLGKDQIFQLRERARQELGERFSTEKFHIEFMRQGTVSPAYFGDELIAQLKQ